MEKCREANDSNKRRILVLEFKRQTTLVSSGSTHNTSKSPIWGTNHLQFFHSIASYTHVFVIHPRFCLRRSLGQSAHAHISRNRAGD